jgi:multidrug efflux pump subunit AcrB
LPGIIVRNSILLVDFIRGARTPDGRWLTSTEAGAIRFKPISTDRTVAMIGAVVTWPTRSSKVLRFRFVWLASSTALTVLVIPAIYVAQAITD